MSEELNNAYKADEATPFINVTPLIDVLLVLLIIFMAISPLKPARFEAKVPAEPKDEQQQVKPNPLSLVVSVNSPEMKIMLNKDEMGETSDTSKLTNALLTIFKEREVNGTFREGTNEVEKTVFLKAPRSIKYGEVVKVIDAVKAAGAQPVGLQVDDLPN
jgi:biopolymer transport protein ExbD